MKLKEFIKTYSTDFKSGHVFLINKNKIRTEINNPNADLISDDQIIEFWNVQLIVNDHGENVITFFIYLKED